jgi:hypothetical protein
VDRQEIGAVTAQEVPAWTRTAWWVLGILSVLSLLFFIVLMAIAHSPLADS